MRHLRLWAAVLLVAAPSGVAAASPLDWPAEGDALALHCAAVLSAYGHAYELALDLAGQTGGAPVDTIPAPIVSAAGGVDRLPEIAARAEGFVTHAESVARTSFYPALVGDGTPYLADDGRDLVLAVQSCVARYGLG
jgi:hypothetical protein